MDNWDDEIDIFEDDVDPDRVMEFSRGIDEPMLYLKRAMPHGMFKVATEKGPVPQALEGRWTDLAMAERAVVGYIEKTVSVVKFKPKGEPAKIKSPVQTAKTDSQRKGFKTRKEAGKAERLF